MFQLIKINKKRKFERNHYLLKVQTNRIYTKIKIRVNNKMSYLSSSQIKIKIKINNEKNAVERQDDCNSTENALKPVDFDRIVIAEIEKILNKTKIMLHL